MNNTLFIAWRTGGENEGRWQTVARLDHDPLEGLFTFRYTLGAQSSTFSPFPGFPDLEQAYASDELFPMFVNRIMASSRPEYPAYLGWAGFDPQSPPDPLALLAVTEGIRQTDCLQVFPMPAKDDNGDYVATFFLHGLRYASPDALKRLQTLEPGEALKPMLDTLNDYDASAVAVRTNDPRERTLLGYAPRYLAKDLSHLCTECEPKDLRLEVAKVNHKAPLQMRLLCRFRSCWPNGFEPCAGEEFQPIVPILQPTERQRCA